MDELLLEIPNKANLAELRELAGGACRTMELLEKHDLQLDDDMNVNLPPPATAASSTAKPPAIRKTASLLEIYDMLREYGGNLNATAEEVRNTVVNKLLLETDNPDARIRLKALELLGKVPEIGLFVDIKAPPPADMAVSDVAARLKARLHELKQSVEGVYEAPSAPDKV